YAAHGRLAPRSGTAVGLARPSYGCPERGDVPPAVFARQVLRIPPASDRPPGELHPPAALAARAAAGADEEPHGRGQKTRDKYRHAGEQHRDNPKQAEADGSA